MINYMITNEHGEPLLNCLGDVCFYIQDYYKISGIPWRWKMYDFRGCVREEVFQPGTPYADGAAFMLKVVAKYIPEIPPSLEELDGGGVELDCRVRSAPYSRMVGGIMRAICERSYALPELPRNYTEAVWAGMDESLALYYALNVVETPWCSIPHSLDHGRIGSWFRLLPEMQERGKRFPPMSVQLSTRPTVRPSWMPSNARTFMEYMCTPLSGRLPAVCHICPPAYAYLNSPNNLFAYLLSICEDQ